MEKRTSWGVKHHLSARYTWQDVWIVAVVVGIIVWCLK